MSSKKVYKEDSLEGRWTEVDKIIEKEITNERWRKKSGVKCDRGIANVARRKGVQKCLKIEKG